MSIFLLILKIIGIVLVSILFLLLLVLCLVLFVPIRYVIYVDKPEDEDIYASVRLNWLLHFVNVKAWYVKELYYRVRIIIFSIAKSDNLKKNKNATNKKSNKNNKEEAYTSDEIKADANINESDVPLDSKKLEDKTLSKDDTDREPIQSEEDDSDLQSIQESSSIGYDQNDSISKNENVYNNDDELNNDKDLPLFNKISIFIERIIDFISNFRSKIEGIVNKIKEGYNNIDYYVSALQDERNQACLAMCISRLGTVLKHIKPRAVDGKIRYGSEEPYNVGKLLSIYGILFPLLHDKIQVVPEYDNDVFEADIYIKGRIMLAIVLWAAFKIYFDKDFRRMKEMFSK